MSLESWRGLPLWIVWIWTTLPGAVALVTLATASSVEQLEPSWEDAARLTGVGSLRAWKTLCWPLVRPRSARAAAVVFLFALVEPGAPLVLGLRRTLAFQIVESADRPDPFPRAAVWAVMAGLLGFVGWILWRWAGGTPYLGNRGNATAASRNARSTRRAKSLRAFASTVLLAAWAIVGWLPLLGLAKLALGMSGFEPTSAGGALRAFLDLPRRFSDPAVPRLLANSLILGLEVACATIAIAWLVGPRSIPGAAQRLRGGFTRPIALLPPLVQAIGVLALPWLAGLAALSLGDLDRWKPLKDALGCISRELDPARNPWIVMSCCVGLALVPRFLWCWQGRKQAVPSSARLDSAFEAALLAGAVADRAVRLSEPMPLGRWLGRFILAVACAATNLTPALLFQPWADGRTVAPAVVVLAAGPAAARSLAATLALGAVAVILLALAVAKLTSALPAASDLD